MVITHSQMEMQGFSNEISYTTEANKDTIAKKKKAKKEDRIKVAAACTRRSRLTSRS